MVYYFQLINTLINICSILKIGIEDNYQYLVGVVANIIQLGCEASIQPILILISVPIDYNIFQKSYSLSIQAVGMDISIPEFEPYKDKIPEFVIKLYHILEQRQYSDYLSWYGDNQILIKNPKKLEDKVLPHFFRHRHLSSFIRQLNMYKFNKVIKMVKEKNYMYFKNEHFRRGCVKELVNIKRNNKKSKKESLSLETISEGYKDDNISIDNQLSKNIALNQYRNFVKAKVKEISDMLKNIQGNHPQLKEELGQTIGRCNELLENQSEVSHNSFLNLEDSKNNTDNMLMSLKFLPAMELFPSQCNF